MNTRYHRIRGTIGSDYIYTFVSSDDYVDTGDVFVFISLAHGALKYLYLDIYENKFWYTILAWFTDVCIVRWFKFAILLYKEWHTLLIDLFVAHHMLKIVKRGKIDTPNTHIHDGSFSWVVHALLSIFQNVTLFFYFVPNTVVNEPISYTKA
jgi:hypothetical protein